MRDLLLSGFGLQDALLLLLRVTLGGFYVLARFRFFFDPSRPGAMFCNADRHQSLTNKMQHCGWCNMPRLWAWTVASIEVSAGLALIFGLLTIPAAFGLLAITIGATLCTAKQKVMEQHPVDCIDCVSCYLWRVEGLYIAMAVAILLAGPGRYSLDFALFG